MFVLNLHEEDNSIFLLVFPSNRCYGRAVQRQKDRASLWHDLGMNYYRQHQYSRDAKMAQKAMQV